MENKPYDLWTRSAGDMSRGPVIQGIQNKGHITSSCTFHPKETRAMPGRPFWILEASFLTLVMPLQLITLMAESGVQNGKGYLREVQAMVRAGLPLAR